MRLDDRLVVDATDANIPGGFRVVRKLGAGSRADVFLGSGTTGTVVLKIFHPRVSELSIGSELDALGRLDSSHFVRLVDIASADDDRPILILERVQRGSVAALLRDRNAMEPGEIVTLLAPLAGALPVLHRLGVGHGRIGASRLYLGKSGEPVLLGFGHCELFARDGSIAVIDAEPAAVRDRDGLAALAVALLSRVRNAATDGRVGGLIEWIDSAPHAFEFPEQLESRLFDFADPVPIGFVQAQVPAPSVPTRFGSLERVPQRSIPDPNAEVAAQPPAGVFDRLEAVLRHNPVDVLRARVVTFVKTVRKPFWAVAGGVIVVFIVATVLLPQGATVPRTRPTSTPAVAESAPTPTPLPDDPVLALPLLLAGRARCIRDRSVLCLDSVDQQPSSAYNDDAAIIQQLQGGSETPKSAVITAAAPTLTELLGDSAIVNLGPDNHPASVLMVRNEVGWRIRDYLSGVQATGTPNGNG